MSRWVKLLQAGMVFNYSDGFNATGVRKKYVKAKAPSSGRGAAGCEVAGPKDSHGGGVSPPKQVD